MCKKMLIAMVVLGYLAGTVSAAMIFEDDFSVLPTTSLSKTGFTWIGTGLNVEPDVVSPPTSFAIACSGGSGTSYGYFLWDIGATYDFYGDGTAECSVMASRFSTASWLRVELLDGDLNQLALAQHSFDDWNVFHKVVVPMDGDETNVRYVRFTMLRYSGTSTTKCRLDDFVVTPEPATILMLLSGGLMAIRKRSRV